MTMGRPLRPLDISDESRAQLESISRSRSMPHMLVRRAKAGLINYKAIIKVREHIIVCRLRRRCSVDTGPFARDC